MKSARPQTKPPQPSTSGSSSVGGAAVSTSVTTGARARIPKSNTVTSIPLRKPAVTKVESSKIPGSSIKRKLSTAISPRTKSSLSSAITPKREKTEHVVAAPSKKLQAFPRPRKLGTAVLQRSVSSSKESMTSCGSRENQKQQALPSGRLATGSVLEKEKRALEQRISELVHNTESKKTEVLSLKMEIGKLKEQQKSRSESVLLEMESLQAENRLLKERLEELGWSPEQTSLSDNQKEFLLQKKCSSAPPSISGAPPIHPFLTNSKNDIVSMESDSCEALVMGYPSMERAMSDRGSLEWDKQSSSSISEMSVANLQDRIMQMEETHYSTSEELQATLQELSDLQDQLMEAQHDNERLSDEKEVLLESLYSKVQLVDDYRLQVDNLKQLLLQQQQDTDGVSSLSTSEREQKLWELLQSSQHEARSLLEKHAELNEMVREAKEEVARTLGRLAELTDREKLLESMVDSANADKRSLEAQVMEMREWMDNEQIELGSLKTLLENEKTKVVELQQARQLQCKSELDELLDQTRKEKDRLEAKATSLQEQLSIGQCEMMRLKDQLSVLQEETMVSKNNAKKHISDVEYKLQQLLGAKDTLHKQALDLQELVHELERKCQRHLEDKRELRATISELQKKLNESSGHAELLQRQLDELRNKRELETEEWKQFQSDLLMTVRVANDFKTEAQLDVETLTTESRQLQDRICSLEAENERLKAMKTTTSPTIHRRPLQSVPNSFGGSEGSVLSSLEHEFVQLRPSRPGRPDNRISVKSIIETIENSSKQTKGQSCSETNSGNGSASRTPSTSPTISRSNAALMDSKSSLALIIRRPENDLYIKPPARPVSADVPAVLRDQKNQANTTAQPLRSLQRNTYTDGIGYQKSPPPSGKTVVVSPSISPEKLTTTALGKSSDGQDSDQVRPGMVINASPVSILTNKTETVKRTSYGDAIEKKDPLCALAKGGGSKRNALLKWCQNKALGYKGIDITNFSSSWNDGLAFCAILHSYLPDLIPYESLDNKDKKRNFTVAFQAAESVGISTLLNTNEMISTERPDWQTIMAYVTSIYKHFET